MSRAKTTKAAKKRSVMGLYRRMGELLNQKPLEALPSQSSSKLADNAKPKGDTK